MKGNQTDSKINFERLLFRRQFLLGPKKFIPNSYWSSITLGTELKLSIHNDLPISTVSTNGLNVTLIGYAIDPYNPKSTEYDILSTLSTNSSDIGSFIESTKPLVGRWVIIFQDQNDRYIFSDPCGFRQVYYYSDENHYWCASQPELINFNIHLNMNTNDDIINFLKDTGRLSKESQWVGSTTLYESCFHLMPNHYLSLKRMDQIRFYPQNSLSDKTTNEIVESASMILQGTMTALTLRHKVRLALTAGWDSRVLLAASKHVSEQIKYFVYNQSNFKNNHADINVPESISRKLGIDFIVKYPPKELPGWFVSILSQNVTYARTLPKTCHIYDKLIEADDHININGNASEICRNFFDKYCNLDLSNISTDMLATKMFGKDQFPVFVTREIDNWRKEFINLSDDKLNILDLFYWEQRLGNWGAQFPAEQDIAVEEISPFNCRLLIEILSSSPRHLRAAPNYPLYRELISYMWPEALDFPINPENILSIMKNRIVQYVPSSAVHFIKKLQN